MDSTVIVMLVLGVALVVAIVALIFYKPSDKNDQPYGPSVSKKSLERQYKKEYGAKPDFLTPQEKKRKESQEKNIENKGLFRTLRDFLK